MNTSLKVSVIIPCYNSAWSLPTLANSLKPWLSDDVEVIFIDDGSTDNSLDLFQSLIPEATCIRQENRGPGATRNRGAKLAKGEFLQLLDADDTVEVGKLEAQVSFAQSHGLDVVYSDWRMVIAFDNRLECGAWVHAQASVEIVEALLGGWWFPPAAALIRKEAFITIGGCDPTLFNTCDDFDLWVRLGIAGCKYGYLPGRFANYYRYLQIHSISRRDRRGFFAGEETIIFNALKLLKSKGTLTSERRQAAARRLHLVARNVYTIDQQWFDRLHAEIFKLDPDFQPSGSWIYRTTARLLGLEKAEFLAVRTRSWRKYF